VQKKIFNRTEKRIIIGADDVVRRRGYCDHFVTMCVYVCVCVGGWVCTLAR